MQRRNSGIELEKVIEWINSMNEIEFEAIIPAIVSRYTILFSESELHCVFLPKNNKKEREDVIRKVMDFLVKQPT